MKFKATENMTTKNSYTYILSQLRKHGKKQENHSDLLQEMIYIVNDYCDDCKYEDFGMCWIRDRPDEDISHFCIDNSIKILESLIEIK